MSPEVAASPMTCNASVTGQTCAQNQINDENNRIFAMLLTRRDRFLIWRSVYVAVASEKTVVEHACVAKRETV
jgi:hypothetical protein